MAVKWCSAPTKIAEPRPARLGDCGRRGPALRDEPVPPGIGGYETTIRVDDSLRGHPGDYYDLVLTNPPFGRKSSLTFSDARRRNISAALPTKN